jgi:hypothetical protein
MFAPKHASFLRRPAQGAQVHFLVYRRASVEGKARFARVQNRNDTCVSVQSHLRRVQDRALSLRSLHLVHTVIFKTKPKDTKQQKRSFHDVYFATLMRTRVRVAAFTHSNEQSNRTGGCFNQTKPDKFKDTLRQGFWFGYLFLGFFDE